MLTAFLLTLAAGLATTVGSVVTLFVKKNNMRFLSGALGFAAGVMIYVSFMDILPEAYKEIYNFWGENCLWYIQTAFIAGMTLVFAIEMILPDENDISLKRMGKMTAIVIALHNFPEGIATFVATLSDPVLGISVACAIALHNIPEGIAVSVPLYYGYGNRKKAIFLSFLSGFSEPVGALCAYVILMPIITGQLLGLILSFVAGIMVFISLYELLPNAWKYGHHTAVGVGLILGAATMAVTVAGI